MPGEKATNLETAFEAEVQIGELADRLQARHCLASRLQSRHFLASRRRRFDLVSLPRGSWVAGLGLVFPCCRGHFRV